MLGLGKQKSYSRVSNEVSIPSYFVLRLKLTMTIHSRLFYDQSTTPPAVTFLSILPYEPQALEISELALCYSCSTGPQYSVLSRIPHLPKLVKSSNSVWRNRYALSVPRLKYHPPLPLMSPPTAKSIRPSLPFSPPFFSRAPVMGSRAKDLGPAATQRNTRRLNS